MKQTIIGGIAVLALVLSLVGLIGGKQSANLGGITNYDQVVVGTNIGIGSTSPASNVGLTVGLANATTTIFTGRLCFAVQTLGSGTGYLYYFPATSTANAAVSGWATSTTPCYP